MLSAIDWRGFDPKGIAARIPENAQAAESQLQRISLSEDGDELFVGETVTANSEVLAFDPAHAVRMISDLVPNPFVGREIVGRLLATLRKRGFDDAKLGTIASLIVEELRKGLDKEQTARAEALFKAGVTAGHIQFRAARWPQLADAVRQRNDPTRSRVLVGKDGNPVQRSQPRYGLQA